MRLFTLLFAILLIGFSAEAQQLVLIPGDTLSSSDTLGSKWDRADFKGHVTNVSGSNALVKWKLIYESSPSSWKTYYCDKNNCLDLSDFSSFEYMLDDGDTAVSKAQFGLDTDNVPFWEKGYGEIHILLYVDGDSANSAVVGVYQATIAVDSSTFVGVETIDPSKDIRVFPNPVREDLNIYMPAGLVSSLVIYDVLGKEVDTKVISSRATLPYTFSVEEMDPGFYFIKLLGKGGEVVTTRKFRKD